MKITITFKDPDGVSDSIAAAARESVAAYAPGLEKDEIDEVIGRREEKLTDALSRWIEYGEYVRIEFDTEAKTATVLPNK